MKGGPKHRIHSIPGLFGTTNHYDEHGNLIGYSQEGLFGVIHHYSADGSNAGFSTGSLLGGQHHFSSDGKSSGYTIHGLFTDQHYDDHGNHAGQSHEGFFSTTTHFDHNMPEDTPPAEDCNDWDLF